MIDLEATRRALPMPDLLRKLGMAENANPRAKTTCPWHSDSTPSFSISEKNGRWKFTCWAGCADGDEVDLVQKTYALATKGEAIKRYAELAGTDSKPSIVSEAKRILGATLSGNAAVGNRSPAGSNYPGKCQGEPETAILPAHVAEMAGSSAPPAQPLSPVAIEKLAAWRGYALPFVEEIAKQGIVQVFQGCIAFPVTGGFHYRKQDGSWRYSKGAKAELFVPGKLEEGAQVHCFESQWDALAYAESQGELDNIVASRGAGNARLIAERLKGHTGALYLWPQNDAPGQKWAKDIAELLPDAQIKLALVHPQFIDYQHKDLNDWRKAGATSGDVWNAFVDAVDFLCHTKTYQTTLHAGSDTTGPTKNVSTPAVRNTGKETEKRQSSTAGISTATTNNASSIPIGEEREALESGSSSKNQSEDAKPAERSTQQPSTSITPKASRLGPLVNSRALEAGAPFPQRLPSASSFAPTATEKDITKSALARGDYGLDAMPFPVPALDEASATGGVTLGAQIGEVLESAMPAKGLIPETTGKIIVSEIHDSSGGKNTLSGGVDGHATATVGRSVETATAPSGHQAPPAQFTLATTLDSIVAFLCRYVSFPLEEQALAIALWVAHSHVFEAFRFSPYLHICSPEKRCGKTRLLESLQLLCPRTRTFVRPSEPVLFRTIQREKPTLLLDEIDTIFGKEGGKDESSEGLRAVLNAGFQAGVKIPRCVGNNHEIAEFSVFCPKVISGIGKIPDTVRDRSIEIRLVRQTEEGKAARFRHGEATDLAAPIVSALTQWAKEASAALADARPYIPEQLSDRAADMCEPLLAIAESAGAEWSTKGREALIALSASNEDTSEGVQLLASCREVFAMKDRDRIPTHDLLEALIGMESADAPWATWWERDLKNGNGKAPAMRLARMLEPYGIKPISMKTSDGHDGEKTVKGYHSSDFRDAFKRYLSPVTGMATMEMAL